MFWIFNKFYPPKDYIHKKKIERVLERIDCQKLVGCHYLTNADDGSVIFVTLSEEALVGSKKILKCINCCYEEIGYSEVMTEERMKERFSDYYKFLKNNVS